MVIDSRSRSHGHSHSHGHRGSGCYAFGCFFWSDVLLPDTSVTYRADAEVSFRGSGKWWPSHSRMASQQMMTLWNDFSIRSWSVKVLKCAQCVTSASESFNAEKVRVRARICVHHPFGLSLSKCQFEEDRRTIHASNKSPWACVLPCVQDEWWNIRCVRSLWLSPGLWRGR